MLIISECKVNKKAVVDGRIVAQTRLSTVVRYLSPLRKIVAQGYGTSDKRSAFNLAVAHILRYGLQGEYPALGVDPKGVRLTKGTLLIPPNPGVVRVEDKLLLTFHTVVNSFNAFGDDRVVLCAYNPQIGVAGINEEECLRMDGHLELELPVQLAEERVQIYLFVHDRKQKRFSDSIYLGEY